MINDLEEHEGRSLVVLGVGGLQGLGAEGDVERRRAPAHLIHLHYHIVRYLNLNIASKIIMSSLRRKRLLQITLSLGTRKKYL